ncbi:hypothetical protein F5Y18DRAFT_152138 [Xylariaceae sp. FL1019]|nr:hypothetical protein F5Y18DRAFT_152138 [Xylariaceae sp. FL1019]
MLSIRLESGQQNEDEMRDWIMSAPDGIEYLGMALSCSALLLIIVPIAVWDLLLACLAVSFVGFTTGLFRPSLPAQLKEEVKEKESIIGDDTATESAAKDPAATESVAKDLGVNDRVLNQPSPLQSPASAPLPFSYTESFEPTGVDSVAASESCHRCPGQH